MTPFPDEALRFHSGLFSDENSTSSRTRALRDRIRAFSRFKSARDSARETSSKRRFQILSKRWERLIEGEVRRIRRNQQLSENEKAVIIENIKERAAEVWKDALSEAPNATKLTRREFGLLRNFAKKLVQEAKAAADNPLQRTEDDYLLQCRERKHRHAVAQRQCNKVERIRALLARRVERARRHRLRLLQVCLPRPSKYSDHEWLKAQLLAKDILLVRLPGWWSTLALSPLRCGGKMRRVLLSGFPAHGR